MQVSNIVSIDDDCYVWDEYISCTGTLDTDVHNLDLPAFIGRNIVHKSVFCKIRNFGVSLKSSSSYTNARHVWPKGTKVKILLEPLERPFE